MGRQCEEETRQGPQALCRDTGLANSLLGIPDLDSLAPQATRGFWTAMADPEPEAAFLCAPVESSYPIRDKTFVTPIDELRSLLADRGFVNS